MRLDRAVVKNFLTYENLDYNFSRNPLLVQGRNLTEEDQESNGSGKSGLFTAIEFCITASNSRDVRDNELVMFGEKQANAELYASCDIRKEQLHIAWLIKVKGSNVLTLKKKSYDGEWEEISFSNVNDGKKYIMNWFDIEKEDLFNYYIINKSRFKTFFKASNKEKVDLINRFSDASIIDGLDKIDNSSLDVEYASIKSSIDKTEGKIELIKEQIIAEDSKDVEVENEQLKKDLLQKIEDHKDDILDVKDEIKQFKISLKQDEGELSGLNSKLIVLDLRLIEAQKLVDEFNETDYSQEIEKSNSLIEVQDDLMIVESEALGVLDIKLTKVNKLIKELSNELSGAITCPSCTHEFTLDCKHGTLEQVKEKFTKANQITKAIENKELTHEETIEKINNRISKLRKDLDSVGDKRELERVAKNDLVKSLNEVNNEVLLLNKNILRVQSLINEHNTDIKDCKSDIKKFDLIVDGFKQEIKNIGVSTHSSNIESLRSDLKALESLLVQFNTKLTEKGDEIYKRNQWSNNFKQFRAHLANQSLEAIEFHMNRYLDGMDSDLKVKMEGFKILANGTFKDEITAKIIRTVERSFSSFSGGEQGRLLFAAILANRHMLNSTHKYGGLDFLSIDEVFEGVDSLGLKKLVKSAKQLDIAVMIITHVTDEEVNDDILLIEKINGISYVKE